MDRAAELLEAVYDGDLRVLAGLLGQRPDDPAVLRAPLYEAAVEGRSDLVRALLEHGADPDTPGPAPGDGLPLCAAACWGHTAAAAELLNAGAGVDRREWDGSTPLLWAAANGHTATVRLLLGHGASTALADGAGRTPLHRAAERGSLQSAEALLQAGADTAARDDRGHTARELALPWVGADLRAEVRRRARFIAGAQPGDRVVVREESAEDDSTVLVAEVFRGDEPRAWTDVQTGHAAIADLLAGHPPVPPS
ncbi:hypothetical protein SRB5_02280 [Streptomyces sp. RB5]|uniref:Ankyrin repeat protein n=1 Tax=Streptomyces smaragdinus TaxID=2585196 RepID=A0A7K0C9R4_9ACTN|nr:ankyrin repeat domain-containing protein [Streptomyces smaragdinus]MQY10123.1 hypothetical protein [Streptomyces smaragdinus]